jgi:hypothetical protein
MSNDELLPHQIFFLLARVVILNRAQIADDAGPDLRVLSAVGQVKVLSRM